MHSQADHKVCTRTREAHVRRGAPLEQCESLPATRLRILTHAHAFVVRRHSKGVCGVRVCAVRDAPQQTAQRHGVDVNETRENEFTSSLLGLPAVKRSKHV
jgi:hypothetical protein